MKRIYLDWNIFTQLKNPVKEPFISIANILQDIKDYVFIPYSTAHLSDLKKGYKNEEPFITYTNQDLGNLSKICRNFHWYYDSNENAVKYIYKDPIVAFEPYKDEEFSVAENMDFQKIFSGMEGFESIGTLMNELLSSIQVPLDLESIPDESELKKPLQEMFQTTGKTTSMLELMKGFGKYYDEINKDPTKYKNLRNGFRSALKLPSNISNWDEETWKKLDAQMKSTLLNKSFTDMVVDAVKSQNKNKEITFHDEFLHAYMNLDLVGFNPEGLSKKNTYTNLFNDSQHAFFGVYSNVFVTNDSNTKAKAKAIYDKYGILTEILTAEEFLQKLKTEIQKVELYNEAPNGLKTDHLVLTRVPNLDGSDYDYKVEYVDFIDKKKMLVGTFDLILGNINFVETTGIGIPHGAMKLLSEWIEVKMQEVEQTA